MFYEIKNLLINIDKIQYVELVSDKKTNTYIIVIHFLNGKELIDFNSYSELIDEYNVLKSNIFFWN